MERKLDIARWHAEHLPKLVGLEADPNELPPIALQAHFEGSGRALASIPDQLASGVCEVLDDVIPEIPKPRAAYLHNVVSALPEGSILRSVLDAIVSDLRYCDLRSWRNRATHRFDRKAMLDGMWEVDYPDGCQDPVADRGLTTYIEIMLSYGEEIVGNTSTVRDLAFDLRRSVVG